jgi:hypothetical protein
MDPDSSSCFYFRFFSRQQGDAWREEKESDKALSWSWPTEYKGPVQHYPFEVCITRIKPHKLNNIQDLPMVENPHWPYDYWRDMYQA